MTDEYPLIQKCQHSDYWLTLWTNGRTTVAKSHEEALRVVAQVTPGGEKTPTPDEEELNRELS